MSSTPLSLSTFWYLNLTAVNVRALPPSLRKLTAFVMSCQLLFFFLPSSIMSSSGCVQPPLGLFVLARGFRFFVAVSGGKDLLSAAGASSPLSPFPDRPKHHQTLSSARAQPIPNEVKSIELGQIEYWAGRRGREGETERERKGEG